MATAKGESSFSTKGKQAKKSVRNLCPVGKWDLKLKTDRAEVKQAKSGRTRIGGIAFEALGAGGDSSKNPFVYYDLHLGLSPGKDGASMVERSNGLVGLSRALGTEYAGPTVRITVIPDLAKPDETVVETALNAQAVLKWLKTLDGQIVKGQVRHERRTGDGAQLDDDGKPMVDARIAYFEAAAVEAEEGDEDEDEDEDAEEGEESDEEGEDEGDEDEDEDTEDDEDSDDDEDEDEEEKPAKKVKAGKKKSKK